MIKDLRYGLRSLLSTPAFFLVAILTMAMGIGLTTTIFSVLDAVVLQPLPYYNAQELFAVSTVMRGQPVGVSAADFIDLSSQTKVFEHPTFVRYRPGNLNGLGDPQAVKAAYVTGDLFSLFNIHPHLGKSFSAESSSQVQPPVAVISYGFWQNYLQSDPEIINKPIRLDDRPLTIIGVMPADFELFDKADLWTPLILDNDLLMARGRRDGQFYARLPKDTSPAKTGAMLDATASYLARQFPRTNGHATFLLRSLKDVVLGDIRSSLMLLFGAVVFVLLVACSNVAHMFLSRALKRRKEIAVRVALGAKQSACVRYFFAEGLILSLCGSAAGLVLASLGLKFIKLLFPAVTPRLASVALTQRSFWLAAGIALISAIIFMLLPSVKIARANPHSYLTGADDIVPAFSNKPETRGRLLLGLQVAISTVLLLSAGLLVKTFRTVTHVSLGFVTNDVVVMNVCLPHYKYPDSVEQTGFFQETLERISTLPGIKKASLSTSVPLSGISAQSSITFAGQNKSDAQSVHFQSVSPSFFATLGIPLLEGRGFNDQDVNGSLRSAVVNQAFVRRFGSAGILGQHIKGSWSGGESTQIVGIVADTRDDRQKVTPNPIVYLPFTQVSSPCMSIIAAGAVPSSLSREIQAEIHAIDKYQPVSAMRKLEEIVSSSFENASLLGRSLSIFALLGLLLISTGVYGIVACWVTQNIKGIGIRIAMGAPSHRILKLAISNTMKVVAQGAIAGIVLVVPLTRVLANFLYGISGFDPLTFITSTGLLLGVSLLACYIPARQALAVDPNVVLRRE